jgi:hypothetical protein
VSNRLLPIVAALCVLVGLADIARGGITLGPYLLVAAYVVLIPAALLRGRLPRRQRRSGPRLSR